jgi:glycosyltransferase involved in cell wall biosynthesis
MSDRAPIVPPRFSIIVATYNYDAYLRRALDSIVAQDGDDFEVLVVDDGSTDQTHEIVQDYGSRVRYFRQEHSGTFAACRIGARAARGQYILFIDADDRLRPGALAALRAAADTRMRN